MERLVRHIIGQLKTGQHIVLTGSRRVGKTTLFNAVVAELSAVTIVQSHFDEDHLNLYYENRYRQIGHRQRSGIQVMPTGFNLAKRAVANSIQQQKRYLAIDEIGFLELWRQDYIDEVIVASGHITLLLVLRKGSHAMKNRLVEIGNYQVVNLDDITLT